jgi:hypothetical protein
VASPWPASSAYALPSVDGVARVALFFHGHWIALMSRHHIDFVALDLAFEHHGGTAIDDP